MASADDLMERARRAYERGRLARAAREAAPLAALPAAAAVAGVAPALAAAAGAALLAAAVALRWRGQGYGRAVLPGVLAGAPALALPLLLPRGIGHACFGGACWNVCLLACLGAGVVAAAVLWSAAPRAAAERRRSLGAGAVVAALTAAPACAFAGLLGVGALLLGLAAGTAPALLRPAPAR